VRTIERTTSCLEFWSSVGGKKGGKVLHIRNKGRGKRAPEVQKMNGLGGWTIGLLKKVILSYSIVVQVPAEGGEPDFRKGGYFELERGI